MGALSDGLAHTFTQPSLSAILSQRDEQTNGRRNRLRKAKKKTKAYINIGSLNIDGYKSAPSANTPSKIKWFDINQLMRERKIGILAVQETHLDEERIRQLVQVHPHLEIINTGDPERPLAKAGVAFVVNKTIASSELSRPARIIIPGRACLISVRWHNTEIIKLLNVYAPADGQSENEQFWQLLLQKWRELRLPRPDVMLGDFNFVETAQDRLPNEAPRMSLLQAFDDLKSEFRLCDGWREAFPLAQDFTFGRGVNSKARLDRIYVSEPLLARSREWYIRGSPIQSDHMLVSTQLVTENAPPVGRGRYQIASDLLVKKDFVDELIKRGEEAQTEIELMKRLDTRTNERNAQTIWTTMKEDWIKIAKSAQKKWHGQSLNGQLQAKYREKAKKSNESLDTMEARKAHDLLLKEIVGLERKIHARNRVSVEARDFVEGSSPSKYLTRKLKGNKPRDILYRLRTSDWTAEAPRYVSNGRKMAERAREYYDSRQSALPNPSPEQIEIALRSIKPNIERRLTNEQRDNFDSGASPDILEKILKNTNGESAAGPDGVTFAIWKALAARHDRCIKQRQHSPFNVAHTFSLVLNDIKAHGMDNSSRFAESWMNPLFKSGDRDAIENYRPISCCNADYKWYEMLLAFDLAKHMDLIIHPDQAGFIPGRNISNQTHLTRLVVQLAEDYEVNGAIFALDQEKAYDRIAHEYLWKIAKEYNLPSSFIHSASQLYSHAYTRVMINGVMSVPFKVTRGVRQGGPLSCLLFIVAIEPLASMLRKSKLNGINIPGRAERLITSLFADDTTVYLHHTDDFNDLRSILNKWCSASGAAFNIHKTYAVPIGTEDYRQQVIRERRLSEGHAQIPDDVQIIPDGKTIRLLGATIGNKISLDGIWVTQLEKINCALKRYMDKEIYPDITTRVLFIHLIIREKTQFKTKTNGMPKAAIEMLTKKIRHIMWAGKRPMVELKILQRPVSEGGLGLFDLETRNTAISLMTVKEYLQFNKRPPWAPVLDALYAKHVPKKDANISSLAKINTFLQSWTTRTVSSPLPEDLKNLLVKAKEFGVRFDMPKFNVAVLASLPAWYHLGAIPFNKRRAENESSKCLRNNHKVRTVFDLTNIARRLRNEQNGPNLPRRHVNRRNCACLECKADRNPNGPIQCLNPHTCAITAHDTLLELEHTKWDPRLLDPPSPSDNLSLTRHRITENIQAAKDMNAIIFDPSTVSDETLQSGFRIFTKTNELSNLRISRARTARIPGHATALIETWYTKSRETLTFATKVHMKSDNGSNTCQYKFDCEQVVSKSEATLCAIIELVKQSSPSLDLTIVMSAKEVYNKLGNKLKTCEDNDWINVRDKRIWKAALSRLRARSSQTKLCITMEVRTPNQIEQNIADLVRTREQPPDLEILPGYCPSGARLDKMKQATIYRILQRENKQAIKTATWMNIARIQATIAKTQERVPSEEEVWLSFRHKDFSRKIRDFKWRSAHNAYCLGNYWSNIEGLEYRSICRICGETESMEHIITDCESIERITIWKLTSKLIETASGTRPELSYPAILGNALRSPTEKANSRSNDRLQRIVIAESEYLIWKLRCRRVIQDETLTDVMITSAWQDTIAKRVSLDFAATQRKFKGKALCYKKVSNTWRLLQTGEEENDTVDWLKRIRVLVGRRRPELDARRRRRPPER
jgi:exonuclease III